MTSDGPQANRPTRTVDSPYAWFRLAVSVMLSVVGSIGMWVVVVVLPTVQLEFDVDRASASFPYTLTMIGFALGNLIVGRYVDRIGITVPVIAAALTLGVGFVSAAMTTSIWQFAIIQGVLIGIGTSATFGPLIANVSHWFERRRGVAIAAAASGNYIAGVLWPTLVQEVVVAYGWRTAYMAIGLLCVATMVPLALLLQEETPRASEAVNPARPTALSQLHSIGLAPNVLQMMLVIAGLSCCVAMSMPQVHIVAYATDLGHGVARGAVMLSLMLAGGVVSRILSGFLADSIGGVRTLLLGSVMQCVALILYLPVESLMSLYIVSLIFGLAQGGIVPSYALIIREYLPAHEAGQRVGLVVMSTLLGMALGGWLTGWIYDLTGSYQTAFLNGIGWNLLNMSIVAMLLWRTRSQTVAMA